MRVMNEKRKEMMKRLFMPGLMFWCVCLMAWMPTLVPLTAEEAAQVVTIGEVRESLDLLMWFYVIIIGSLFTIQCGVIFTDWLMSRTHETK